MTRTALYRCFDAEGQLLYVGITKSPKKRQSEHRRGSVWYPQMADMTVEWFDDEDGARSAESAAIRSEGALYNVIDGTVKKRDVFLDGTTTWAEVHGGRWEVIVDVAGIDDLLILEGDDEQRAIQTAMIIGNTLSWSEAKLRDIARRGSMTPHEVGCALLGNSPGWNRFCSKGCRFGCDNSKRVFQEVALAYREIIGRIDGQTA